MAKAFSKWGCSKESVWPYKKENLHREPSKEAYEDALNWKVKKYYWPKNQNEIKWALSNGFPVGVGIEVYDGFYNPPNGIVPMPSPGQPLRGRHWIVLCGHNDSVRFYDLANSWTKNWGVGGFAKIPYDYIENYASDYLVLEFGEVGIGPPPPIPWYTRFMNWIKSWF